MATKEKKQIDWIDIEKVEQMGLMADGDIYSKSPQYLFKDEKGRLYMGFVHLHNKTKEIEVSTLHGDNITKIVTHYALQETE